MTTTTETIHLSEVQGRREILPGYSLDVHDGPNQVLVVGSTMGHSTAKFQGAGVAALVPAVFDFKHSRPDGHKWWTAKAGVERHFIIPKDRIDVLRYEGYSYPKVRVGGVTLTLDVSGGTAGDGWVDMIRATASTMADLPVKVLKAIDAAALKHGSHGGVTHDVATLAPYRAGHWKQIEAERRMPGGLKPGMTLKLLEGWAIAGVAGAEVEFVRMHKRTPVVSHAGALFLSRHIDWHDAATRHGLDLTPPEAWNRFGTVTTPEDR